MIPHPTGSEEFARELAMLGAPAPWRHNGQSPGEIRAADDAYVADVSEYSSGGVSWILRESDAATALAMWVIMAVNTLAGFKAEGYGMSGEHTPGPWQLHPNNKGDVCIPHGEGFRIIASVQRFDRENVQWPANARLIAAAPETAAERDRLRAELECKNRVIGYRDAAIIRLETEVATRVDEVERLKEANATTIDGHTKAELVRASAEKAELVAVLDADTLEAIADEIDCHEHSARAASLRVLARQHRAALAKATATEDGT